MYDAPSMIEHLIRQLADATFGGRFHHWRAVTDLPKWTPITPITGKLAFSFTNTRGCMLAAVSWWPARENRSRRSDRSTGSTLDLIGCPGIRWQSAWAFVRGP